MLGWFFLGWTSTKQQVKYVLKKKSDVVRDILYKAY